MANISQPQVFINYISQRKKICVNRNNQPSQLLIQTDYYLNDTLYFKVINVNNQIVELDSNTTYQIYGTYIDAKKTIHILFSTLGVTPTDNTLSFVVNTYTSEYLAYVKSNRTPIDISIVAKQTLAGGGTKSYMVLRDSALANPRGYIEGQAPTDIVYQNVFNANVPVTGSFGAGTNLNLAQDLEGQDIGSFAFGDTLTTSNENQFVIGYNNTPDATKAFIIANSGNIFTVDLSGNVEAGDLNVGAISATSITVSGEDLNQVIDDKVEYLSTAFDDKLSTTENWVNETFQPISTALENFNELTASIDALGTATDGKFEATSGWVNETFETSANAAAAYNALEQDISDLSTAADGKFETQENATSTYNYLSSAITGLNNGVLVNYATKEELNTASSALTGQTNYLSGQVSGQGESINQITNALGSKANVTDLENYVLTSSMSAYATSAWTEETYMKKGDVPTDVYTKDEVDGLLTGYVENDELTAYATKDYVGQQGFLVESDLTDYALKSEIPVVTGFATKDELSAVNDKLTGYALKTDLEPYAYASALNVYAKLTDLNDYAKTSSLTIYATRDELTGYATKNDISNFITLNDVPTYTAGEGIKIENYEISITGALTGDYVTQEDLTSALADYVTVTVLTSRLSDYALKTDVKTYSADNETLKLDNSTNKFSIKSLSSILTGGVGIEVTTDSNGVTTITNTGGGGGEGTTYTAGEGLDLTGTEFSVSESWLTGKIDAQTSGLQNLSAGTGLEIVDNVISLTATIPSPAPTNVGAFTNDVGYVTSTVLNTNILTSYATKSDIVGMATTGYVTGYCSAYITEADLNGYAKTEDIPTTVAELTDAGNYVLTSEITGFITSTALEPYAKTSAVADTYATKETVNGINDRLIAIEADYVTSDEISDFITEDALIGLATKAELSAVDNKFSGYVETATLNDYALKTEVPTTVAELTDAGNYVLTSAITGFITSSDLTDELTAYATQDWVTNTALADNATQTWVTNEISGKAEQSTVEGLSTALSTAITGVVDSLSSKANVADVYTKNEVYTKDETTGAINTATSGKADKTTVETLSTNLSGAIDYVSGVASANTTNIGLIDGRVQTIESDYLKAADISDMATETWVNEQGFISGITIDIQDVETREDQTEIMFDSNFDFNSEYITLNVQNIIENNNIALTSDIPTDVATSAYVTGLVNDLATGAVATNTTNIGLVSDRVGAIEADYIKSTDLTATSTYINSVSSTLNSDLTGKINTASTTLTAQTNYLSGQLDTTNGKVSTNETNIGLVSSDLGTLSGELNTTSTFLSGKVSTLSGELDTASTTLLNKFDNYYDKDAVDGKFEATSTYIGTVSSNIEGDITSAYNDLTGKINTASSTLTSQTNYISGQVDANNNSLTSRVKAIEDDYTTSAYVTGQVNDVVTGQINPLTARVKNIEDTYYTQTQIDNKFTATSTYINEVSTALSNAVPTSVYQIATAGSGITISEQGEIALIWNTIPSAVSQLINDVGYVTETGGGGTGLEYYGTNGISVVGAEISLTATIPTNTNQLENGAGYITISDVPALSTVYDLLSGVNVDITQDENGIITLSAGTGGGGTTYTAGTGIAISNQNVISLTAEIPTVPTNISDFTNDSGYVTSTVLENDYLTSYAQLSDIPTVPVYTAGVGLVKNGTEFSLSAAGVLENKVLSSHNGVISWETNVAGGGGGGGTTYTAGTGIDIQSDVISCVLTGVSDLTNDVGFITNEDLTNKQRVSDPTPAVTVIDYNPAYEIFKTTYTVSDGAIELSAVTDTSGLLTNGDVATFEEWITTASNCTATVATGINLIGEIPSLASGNYHVFVRRLVKTGNTVTQYVSFAYEAPIPVSE